MTYQRKFLMGAVLYIATLTSSVPVHAQVQASGYVVPASLAVEASMEAIRACEANGYKVSATVVDTSGEVRAFVKGDHSTTHTKETSFRKAYTVATMGPVFGFDALGVWVERLKSNPSAPALASVPNIIVLPGAVALKAKGEIVAALGVGGAPGGEKDEACAVAGLAKIQDRLPR
jgi:uncharacterized protein GlcG (DUF336 family)